MGRNILRRKVVYRTVAVKKWRGHHPEANPDSVNSFKNGFNAGWNARHKSHKGLTIKAKELNFEKKSALCPQGVWG